MLQLAWYEIPFQTHPICLRNPNCLLTSKKCGHCRLEIIRYERS
uniref:Uncharacterized protein n=1 Tax=Anguilla anguilla TaxID=7936 RepID=A0A0E9TR89_ANGAN